MTSSSEAPNDGSHTVPADFPRGGETGSVAGAQPKVLARVVDGRYITGLTEEELHARWYFCEDLAIQFAARTTRKLSEGLVTDLEAFYRDTERRIRAQPWGLSEEEIQWLMKRSRELQEKS